MLEEVKKTNGMLVRNDVKYVNEELTGKKAVKQQTKDDLTIPISGVSVETNELVENVELQADNVSLGYLANVVTIANGKFNIAIANGTPMDEAKAIYDNQVPWKAADNTEYLITVVDIIEVLELSMYTVGDIVGVR